MILLALNSFKEIMPSSEISSHIERGIKSIKKIECNTLEVSDGGDGFLDSLDNLNYDRHEIDTLDPYQNRIRAELLISENKEFGIIEIANICGLKFINKDAQNQFHASSKGIGIAIDYCLNLEIENIVLGLGGSGISDLGIGASAYLGTKFIDSDNSNIDFSGTDFDLRNVKKISKIEYDKIAGKIQDSNIILAADVYNPLLGPLGSANLFAKNKGATKDDIATITEIHEHYRNLILKLFNLDINVKMNASAGGFSSSFLPLVNSNLVSGFQFFRDNIKLDLHIQNSDVIITGEGIFDKTSLNGKFPLELLKLSKKYNRLVFGVFGKKNYTGVERHFDFTVELDKLKKFEGDIYDAYFTKRILPEQLYKAGQIIAKEVSKFGI